MRAEANIDKATVSGFGDEWSRFDQTELSQTERQKIFDDYFDIFPRQVLNPASTGADFGVGSGRWAMVVAPMVRQLICVDASEEALQVAKHNLSDSGNCSFILSTVEEADIPQASLDFGYSLGVLHHIPNTRQALAACVSRLKPGAPFLAYLYYRFDNRPFWYRTLWKCSDIVRKGVSKLPHSLRFFVSQVIAGLVYWPLARFALLVDKLGASAESLPLSYYRDKPFYVMRTDALDRFGTRLEQRFTRAEIQAMMEAAGLSDIEFSSRPPYWCAVGYKRSE